MERRLVELRREHQLSAFGAHVGVRKLGTNRSPIRNRRSPRSRSSTAGKVPSGAVRSVVEELSQERTWRSSIFEIEWIGVDALRSDWTLVRASLKIAPLRQKDLRREINARVRDVFGESGIGLGAPIPAEFVPPT